MTKMVEKEGKDYQQEGKKCGDDDQINDQS